MLSILIIYEDVVDIDYHVTLSDCVIILYA